jgi:hypothetical protein
MSRHPLFIVPSILLLAACPGGSEDSESTGVDPSTEGINLTPANEPTTGEPDSSSTAPPTTGDDTTTGDDSTTEELNCGVDGIEAKVKIPRVMLVLDKSGSMVNAGGFWDADGDDADGDGFVDGDPNMAPATPKITRWNSLYSVVEFIVDGFEPRMDFGAVLFPSTDATKSYDASACPVNAEPEVPVGTDQGAMILATIPGPTDVSILGGTPAAQGVMTALGGLPPDMSLPEGEEDLRYIVLVTDGAANCAVDAATDKDRFESYDEHLPENVAAALAAGIPTFVVGIDIKDEASKVVSDGNPDATNTYERLNELATIGGQPREGAEKFYNTVNQLELQAALMKISEVITSCTFDLTNPLSEYQYVRELTVETDMSPLEYDDEQVEDCAAESGWRFTDETRTAIELCGDACTAYKATGKVEIIFDCQAL